ncbi:non-ribosomal peptide synthetase [Microvirga sp. VF16]|uniref:non-ribosomal peptide synthetase n=1 Tax=Microvirga sp. VF16 TaxID=2807101 RepID=UPI00193E8682|nr:non-ribosomal peptide synthetase [Microvirga sp. VF16]QRM32607.1 amino acid adenylation domain-containing protein [Microvirga sp. VF16]
MTPRVADPAAVVLPVSDEQRRLWFLNQLGGADSLNHLGLGLQLSGALDLDALEAALAAVTARHEALRTRLVRRSWGELEPVVVDQVVVALGIDDLTGLSPEEQGQQVAAISAQELRQGFDLDAGPLCRARLLRRAADDHMLLLTCHRIASDDASGDILLRDLMACYEAVRDGGGGAQSQARPFGAYLGEATAWFASPDGERHLQHLRQTLGDACNGPDLPIDGPRRAQRGHDGASLDLDLEAADVVALTAMSRALGVEADDVVLAVLTLLLRRYGAPSAFQVGLLAPNRCRAWHDIVGPLAHIVPFALRVDGRDSFVALVHAVHRARREGVAQPAASLEQIAAGMTTVDTARLRPQVLFEHHVQAPLPHRAGGLTVTAIERCSDRLPAELCLTVTTRRDGGFEARLRYARDLFSAGRIARMAQHFRVLLRTALADPDTRLAAFALLSPADLEPLSAPWPDAEGNDPRLVHQLIAAQARARPDAVAVICGHEALSFGALDRAANRLAHRLLRRGALAEVRIGIAMVRSPRVIVALLAVMKAGASFVPVDPSHPADRIAWVLGNAGVVLLLTDHRSAAQLPELPGVDIFDLDALDLSGEPDAAPDVPIHPDQRAYVIYTSGSTGRPKGVEVAHGPLSMHCQATGLLYEMGPDSRELHVLSFGFDGGQERWMTPLAFGGSIVMRDADLWSVEETHAAMLRHGVTHAGFPPSYLLQLAEYAERAGAPPTLDLCSFGGEAMPRETFELVKRSLRPRLLINGYGPTETVISPMVWKADQTTSFETAYAPIGRAVGARRAYVLDDDLHPVPIGVIGELYLGGEGLGRGYLGHPQATAERFLPDPFFGEGARMYRTGDLARWRPDGIVEYLGRRDHQVKLRGFRIEPGEIEARLMAHASVGEAVVLLRQDEGGPRLVGYVAPAPGATIDPTALRRGLAAVLPDYMVPAVIVALDRFPTTSNGKIDRAALPAPSLAAEDLKPPRSALERDLAEIWQEVLKQPVIGIDQNFFEIGGDSLKALRVVSALGRRRPELKVAIADLFNHPRIEDLAAVLGQARDQTHHIVHLRQTGDQPTLYCFPGLLVSTREYQRLVDHLGPRQPAVGFICHSLTDGTDASPGVEDLAARYADEIRQRSRGQSCVLVGWSWGGILAFEAARLLRGSVDVRFVGMLDVCALDAAFAPDSVMTLADADRRALLVRLANWLPRSTMQAEWQRLIARMDHDSHTRFLCYIRDAKEDLPLDGPDPGSREHLFWVLMENALVFRRYRMTPLDVPVQAWVAEDSLRKGLNVIDWRRYSQRVERVEIVPGTTHLDIIGARAFHDSFRDSLAMHADRRDVG